jgi:hypothetical protein
MTIHCTICSTKLPAFLDFRYECSGCQHLFCERHLDWRYGHVCPGAAEKFLKSRQKLSGKMHRVVEDKILKI